VDCQRFVIFNHADLFLLFVFFPSSSFSSSFSASPLLALISLLLAYFDGSSGNNPGIQREARDAGKANRSGP
jgi:hypothetical protein